LAGSQDNVIKIWDPIGGQELATLYNPSRVLEVAWSRQTPVLAAVVATQRGGMSLVLWDTKAGQQIKAPIPIGYEGSMAWSPDGAILAFSGWDDNYANERITFYDVAAGQVLRVLNALATSLAWSPDGRFLAVANARDGS